MGRFTKFAYFITVKSTYSVEDYARIFIDEIMCLHGIPLSIISNRDAKFISRILRSFIKGLGTNLKLSTVFSPKRMVKRIVRYKPLNICLEHALLILMGVGIGIYL